MRALFAVTALILMFSFIVVDSKVITGGDEVEVIGTGEKSNGSGDAPTPISPNYSPSPRDPSQYRSPGSNVTPPTPNSTNETSNLSFTYNRYTNSIAFESRSSVSGYGKFATRRSISQDTGLAAKQTSSATRPGNYSNNNFLVLQSYLTGVYFNRSYGDNYSSVIVDEYEPTYIVALDSVEFTGPSYHGRESYSNNGDLIKSDIESESVIKESRIVEGLDNASFLVNISKNQIIIRPNFNKYIDYGLAANFVGTLGFSTLASGSKSAEVSEEFKGIMNLSLRAQSRDSVEQYNTTDIWLGCCGGTDRQINQLDYDRIH